MTGKLRTGIRLDIGCADHKQGPTWTGMDIRDMDGVDVVHDIRVLPWPFENESVLTAVATHVLEHIPKDGGLLMNVINEVWRILQPGGEFLIIMPHGRSDGYLQDPTHCSAVNETLFAYFDPAEFNGEPWAIYKPPPWRIKLLNSDPMANIEVVMVKRPPEELTPEMREIYYAN